MKVTLLFLYRSLSPGQEGDGAEWRYRSLEEGDQVTMSCDLGKIFGVSDSSLVKLTLRCLLV